MDTVIAVTSALSVINLGTGPALYVEQDGVQPIAHFVDRNGDDIIFDDDGKVGIGTYNPSVQLDVYNGSGWGGIDVDGCSGGEIRLQKAGTTYLDMYATDTGSTGSVIKATDHLHIATNNSTAAGTATYFKDDGNVGIGTTTPNEKLTVAGNISASGDVCIGDDLVVNGESITICGASAQLNFCDTTDSDDMYMTFANAGTTYACVGYMSTADFDICTNNRDISLLPGTHNVGIGTSSPAAKLTVQGTVSADGSLSAHYGVVVTKPGTAGSACLELKGKGNSTGDQVGIVEFKSHSGAVPLASVQGIRHNDDVIGCLAFSTSNSERVRIDNDGNVGIGTADPDYKLEVNSNTADNGIRITSNNTARHAIDLWTESGTNGGGDIRLYTGVNLIDTRFRQTGSFVHATCTGSNFGVGTCTPNEKLTVAGNISATGSLSAACGISVPDQAAITLGNDHDFTICHQGSQSYITDQGTGGLYLRTKRTSYISYRHRWQCYGAVF